eukprot:6694984-Prorocentrum_lima.AAC.1
MLTPSRVLRDETTPAVMHIVRMMHLPSPKSKVMWLGRPSETIYHLGTREEMVEKSIKEWLKDQLQYSERLERQINEDLSQVAQ